jgi:hypothetical protein
VADADLANLFRQCAWGGLLRRRLASLAKLMPRATPIKNAIEKAASSSSGDE